MTASIGHNSVAGDQLKAIVQRIERMNEEKQAIADDIKDIYAEAKSNGFDVKVIRGLVARRKKAAKDPEGFKAYEDLLDTYSHAIGDLLE